MAARRHPGRDMIPGEPVGLRGGPVYLDYNATTPVDSRVLAAMLPFLQTHFGNPSSDHHFGSAPRHAVARARAQVSGLIGAAPGEIVFTATGSEADATAIRGAVLEAKAAGIDRPQVITQVTEHPAVLAACRDVERYHRARVTILPVGADGVLDPGELLEAVTPDTVLVTVMLANNETGALQPISQLAAITHEHGALFHTDAAQAVGKIPVDLTELGVDLLTLVGHKMYAPKGVAALYIRTGTRLRPLVGGGGQESGLRAGTENVPYIVALGTAAALAAADLADGSVARLTALRDELQHILTEELPDRVLLNGPTTTRLPQTLNISIDGVESQQVLHECPTLAASTGSACHSGEQQPSPVLLAMGQLPTRARSAFRLSLGRWTTRNDIITAGHALARAIDHLSAIAT